MQDLGNISINHLQVGAQRFSFFGRVVHLKFAKKSKKAFAIVVDANSEIMIFFPDEFVKHHPIVLEKGNVYCFMNGTVCINDHLEICSNPKMIQATNDTKAQLQNLFSPDEQICSYNNVISDIDAFATPPSPIFNVFGVISAISKIHEDEGRHTSRIRLVTKNLEKFGIFDVEFINQQCNVVETLPLLKFGDGIIVTRVKLEDIALSTTITSEYYINPLDFEEKRKMTWNSFHNHEQESEVHFLSPKIARQDLFMDPQWTPTLKMEQIHKNLPFDAFRVKVKFIFFVKLIIPACIECRKVVKFQNSKCICDNGHENSSNTWKFHAIIRCADLQSNLFVKKSSEKELVIFDRDFTYFFGFYAPDSNEIKEEHKALLGRKYDCVVMTNEYVKEGKVFKSLAIKHLKEIL